MINLMLGDCLDKLLTIESHSVDSIITDPPFALQEGIIIFLQKADNRFL